MGGSCCSGDQDAGNHNVKHKDYGDRKGGAKSNYGTDLDASAEGVYQYVSEKARERAGELGPFEPDGFNMPSIKLKETDEPLEENGFYYMGRLNVDTNRKDGFGVQAMPDKSLFEGFFKNDKKHGEGRLITYDGEVIKGEW